MHGKTALITGAAQGLGRGIALELAKAGANIVVADLDVEKGNRVAVEIKEMGLDAIAVYCNVTDEASIKKCIETALEYFAQK